MKAVPGMELQQLVLLSATLYKVAESDNVRRGKSGSGFTMTDRSQPFHFRTQSQNSVAMHYFPNKVADLGQLCYCVSHTRSSFSLIKSCVCQLIM